MKTPTILGSLALVFLLLYGCTHQVVYTTVYPRKAAAVQAIYLSPSGEAILQTSDGWLRFSVLQQLRAYPFPPSSRRQLKPGAPLPQWRDMQPGTPPQDVLRGFEKVALIRATLANGSTFSDPKKVRAIDAAVTYENEGYAYGEAFAWLTFRLYSNRPLYSGFDAKLFSVELPARVEWHLLPRKMSFMSIGG